MTDMQIKVGTHVRVTDTGLGFSSYNEWAHRNGLANWAYGTISSDDVGVVKVLAKHGSTDGYGMLAGVERANGSTFIIGVRGLVSTDESGVDADGNIVKFGIEDIKDFMRVVVGGNTYIAYTNARNPELPLYITNGHSQRRLNFDEVEAVYSQPATDLLSPCVLGKLKFKRTDVAALLKLQANVVAAEAALVAAKAALVAGK